MKKMKIALSLIFVLCLTFSLAGCASDHNEGKETSVIATA